MTHYGISVDSEYNATHKRERISVWSGQFMGTWEAEGYSLPKRNGYMLTTYNGDKVRVECPLRTADNYREVDVAISAALHEHFALRGCITVGNSPELEERVAALDARLRL